MSDSLGLSKLKPKGSRLPRNAALQVFTYDEWTQIVRGRRAGLSWKQIHDKAHRFVSRGALAQAAAKWAKAHKVSLTATPRQRRSEGGVKPSTKGGAARGPRNQGGPFGCANCSYTGPTMNAVFSHRYKKHGPVRPSKKVGPSAVSPAAGGTATRRERVIDAMRIINERKKAQAPL